MPTVDIPGVGTVDFPDGMPPDQIRAAAMKLHAAPSVAAEQTNVSDTKDQGFGDLMMMGDDQIDSMKAWAPVVGGMVAGPVAGAVSDAAPMAGGLLKALSHPYVVGGIAGARTLISTHNPIAAAESALKAATIAKVAGIGGGLLAHLRGASAVASVAPAIAEATAGLEEAAAPLAGRAYQGIPSLMKIASTAPEDAAMAAQAARAAQGARGAASIADLVQPAAQAAPAASTVVTAAKDLAGTGGGASGYVAGLVNDAAPAAKEAETLLETRLRASVLAKQNPQALTDEIVAKVQSLKEGVGKGLSAAQVGASIEDMYGLGKSQAHNMAKMIFSAMGYE